MLSPRRAIRNRISPIGGVLRYAANRDDHTDRERLTGRPFRPDRRTRDDGTVHPVGADTVLYQVVFAIALIFTGFSTTPVVPCRASQITAAITWLWPVQDPFGVRQPGGASIAFQPSSPMSAEFCSRYVVPSGPAITPLCTS